MTARWPSVCGPGRHAPCKPPAAPAPRCFARVAAHAQGILNRLAVDEGEVEERVFTEAITNQYESREAVKFAGGLAAATERTPCQCRPVGSGAAAWRLTALHARALESKLGANPVQGDTLPRCRTAAQRAGLLRAVGTYAPTLQGLAVLTSCASHSGAAASPPLLPRVTCRAGVLLAIPLAIGFVVSRAVAQPLWSYAEQLNPAAFAATDNQKVEGAHELHIEELRLRMVRRAGARRQRGARPAGQPA